MTVLANPQLMSEKERSGKIICSITSPETGKKIEWTMDSENIAMSSNEVYILRSNNNNDNERE